MSALSGLLVRIRSVKIKPIVIERPTAQQASSSGSR